MKILDILGKRRKEQLKDQRYRVVEIFNSIEGEGKRAGTVATFIRLYKCNLRCSYCDTPYGYKGSCYTYMSASEIINECHRFGTHNITLTGGEPLYYPEEAKFLVDELVRRGYEVNIETNGSVDLKQYFGWRKPGSFFTMDLKCPSSDMSEKMSLSNLDYLDSGDVIKCVVGSTEDMAWAFSRLREHKIRATVYFSPVFGKIEPSKIAEYIKLNQSIIGIAPEIRLQLQIHKFIYPVDMRGV